MSAPYYELLKLAETGDTIATLGEFTTLEAAEFDARMELQNAPSLWLSIVYVDADGIADPVVVQVAIP